jgi:hypothetical protein
MVPAREDLENMFTNEVTVSDVGSRGYAPHFAAP